MKTAKESIRTIIWIVLIAIALAVVVSVVMYFMGYPVYLLSWTDLSIGYFGFNDPFEAAVDKHYDTMDSILVSFVPDISRYYLSRSKTIIDNQEWVVYYESFYKGIISYLISHDFSDELKELEHCYQMAVQGDKASKSQREEPKMYRGRKLSSIQKEVDKLKVAIEAAQKYKGDENPLITEEDKKILKDLIFMAWRV